MSQAGSSDLPEVLELVLSSTTDAALLCKSTAISSYYKDLSVLRVQQHLPQLLVTKIKQAAATARQLQRQIQQDDSSDGQVLQQLQQDKSAAEATATDGIWWLCRTAGKAAAGQQHVIAALLSPDMVVVEQDTAADRTEERTTWHRAWAWGRYAGTLARAGRRLCEPALVSALDHLWRRLRTATCM